MKPSKKAYTINWELISESYLYDHDAADYICYAETLGKAKSELMKALRFMSFLYRDDDITFLNAPVVRCHELDIFSFKEGVMTKKEHEELEAKNKRIRYMEGILNNPNITHCYIRKRGSYYSDNNQGYTGCYTRAGVYTKEEAVSSAKSCDELSIEPINAYDHNEMVHDQIAVLMKRIIKINH